MPDSGPKQTKKSARRRAFPEPSGSPEAREEKYERNCRPYCRLMLVVMGVVACNPAPPAQNAAPAPGGGAIDRTILPLAEPARATYSELDARKAKAPPRFEVKAPAGAPNVVIVLIDDIGFGGPSTFGGPIRRRRSISSRRRACATTTSTPRRCARRRASRSRPAATTTRPTPARSWRSPRRSRATPGRSRTASRRSRRCCASTATAPARSASGTRPPPGRPACRSVRSLADASGFDKFYGFIGGETDQWSPLIYDGVDQGRSAEEADYHFTDDMTDQAINWVKASSR